MDKITSRARLLFLSLIFLFLIFFIPPLFSTYKSGELGEVITNTLSAIGNSGQSRRDYINHEIEYQDDLQDGGADVGVSESMNINKNLSEPTSMSEARIEIISQKSPNPTRACFRYKVTHLDSSVSNLCYSEEDYNQLVNIGYKYSSAKSFYEFHLDGAEDYQREYERTGSSIYLDAKASQEAEAQEEKDKMTQAIAQMQEIEKRGW